MSVAITMKLPEPISRKVDLEVPENIPVRHLTAALIQALRIPTVRAGWLVEYRMAWKEQPLPAHQTLEEIGVKMGDTLEIVQHSLQLSHHGGAPGRGSATLRFVTGAPVMLDRLGKTELLIGRGDPRSPQQPDIDLSVQPDGDTVSRTHARLRKQGEQWILMPLSSRNGTFIGGTLIPPNQPYVLRSGDVIGFGAVRCVFTAAIP